MRVGPRQLAILGAILVAAALMESDFTKGLVAGIGAGLIFLWLIQELRGLVARPEKTR